MRLIDADELIRDRVENDPIRIAAKCAPTAYDADKVVEQIKRLSEPTEQHIHGCCEKISEEQCNDYNNDCLFCILEEIKNIIKRY